MEFSGVFCKIHLRRFCPPVVILYNHLDEPFNAVSLVGSAIFPPDSRDNGTMSIRLSTATLQVNPKPISEMPEVLKSLIWFYNFFKGQNCCFQLPTTKRWKSPVNCLSQEHNKQAYWLFFTLYLSIQRQGNCEYNF